MSDKYQISNIKWKLILYAFFFFAIWSLLFNVVPVSALGLKVAPLLYEEELKDGEKKKGFIDISNPNDQSVVVTTEIKGFQQANNNGNLKFYNQPDYLNGIQLDFTRFRLGPREALRLYFLLDADKLPEGGVYATIFFKTTADNANPDNTSIQPSTRVGTLLLIENGGGGIKNAEITALDANRWQFGNVIKASASVENTGDENGLAFFPTLQAKAQPFGTNKKGQAPLVFPGIKRKVPLKLDGNYFGPIRLTVTTEDSTAHRWIFAAIGHGRWAGPLFIITAIALLLILTKYKYQIVNKPRRK